MYIQNYIYQHQVKQTYNDQTLILFNDCFDNSCELLISIKEMNQYITNHIYRTLIFTPFTTTYNRPVRIQLSHSLSPRHQSRTP